MCRNKNNSKMKTYNTHYVKNSSKHSDNDDIILGVLVNLKLISELNNETLEPLKINILLNNINIKFQIDTESLHSLMSENCYLEHYSHGK